MDILDGVDLQRFNTLAIPARADHYVRVEHPDELQAILQHAQAQQWPVLILGGGSNTVFSGDFHGLVLHLAIAGIEAQPSEDSVLLRVGAGENWDQLVRHCLAQGWYGLENLIAIPGSVGAAPVQNIGAYGVELASVLVAVEGWDMERGETRTLSAEDCRLSYRDSVFKHALKDRFIISHVHLRLTTRPEVNCGYPALAEALPEGRAPTPQLVAETIAGIRHSKLPDPADIPNAGSFFKNPIVEQSKQAELLSRFPKMPGWPMADGRVKLAAGWLVDQAGWKGARAGGVGVYERQALVLINPERCSGEELLRFAGRITDDVRAKFGVSLEIEPRVY